MAITILDYEPRRAFTLVAAAGGVTAGDIVNVGAAGTAAKANADDTDPSGNGNARQPVGMAAHSAAAGERVLVLPGCTIQDDSDPWSSLSYDRRLYLGAQGLIVVASLVADDDIAVVIGRALTDGIATIDIHPLPIVAGGGVPVYG